MLPGHAYFYILILHCKIEALVVVKKKKILLPSLNSESQYQTPIFQREGQHPKVAYTWIASNVFPDIPHQVFLVNYDHSVLYRGSKLENGVFLKI